MKTESRRRRRVRGASRRPEGPDLRYCTARLVKRIGLDGTADRKGSFLNDIAVDEARKVAWPAADPSQATGRVKRHDNQLHRARVLEVRIQSPPAGSLRTIGS